ncbi:E3 ubiquitin-protein ligase uhrf1 [Linnemannia exigua]|uniref:E3 ubiquitin-protein ligase uhrf1 n=1 Tax=Linnemannia exigua TaxID=604196 RepID=A0AAD4DAJ2_9FUNG|nr:E3 ubiquitin-protein ligase uhrf1 [Linnemannia exigua]
MKINYHLIHQPNLVESIIVPSINTTVKRVRERIAEAYQVDDKAFHMYYLDHQLDNDSTLNNSGFLDKGTIVITPITYDGNHDHSNDSRVTVKATRPTSSRIAKNSRAAAIAQQHSAHAQDPKRKSRRSRSSSVTLQRSSPLKEVKLGPSGSSSSSLTERQSTHTQEQKQEPPPSTSSSVPKPTARLPMRFVGPIPGIPVGAMWPKRIDVSHAGVHRPAMAGISGQADVGAESVALSGGYADDDDKGFEFTYTGAGGNECGKQTRNQDLSRANHGLALTCDCPIDTVKGGEAKDWHSSRPIRVVRGAHLKNIYAPRSGYRYDGIYKVVKYWPEVGKAGFRIWRYLMRRDDPEPAPWTMQSVTLPLENPAGVGSSGQGAGTSHPLGSAARESFISPSLYTHVNHEPINERECLLNAPLLHFQSHNDNWARVGDMKSHQDVLTHQALYVRDESEEMREAPMSAIGASDHFTVVGEDTGIGDETASSGYAAGVGCSEPQVKAEEQDGETPSWLQTDRTADQLLEDWI